MAMGRSVGLLLLFGVASSAGKADVSPVEKVIDLISGLLSEVKAEGEKEAKTYEEFACFCKDETKLKADAILEEEDNINEYAATMQEGQAESDKKGQIIQELEKTIGKLDKEISDLNNKRNDEKTKYEQTASDLESGVDALDGAIEDASQGADLIQMDDGIMNSLVIADALDLVPDTSKKAVSAMLLQTQDGGDGGEDKAYDFHAEDLINTFKKLEHEFTAKKAEVDQIEAQSRKDFTKVLETKTTEKTNAEAEKETFEEEKAEADKVVAEATDKLVEEKRKLQDDQDYLKDVTDRCSLKAREWDQASQMRNDEATALTKALDIITQKVKGASDNVNKRALLQESSKVPPRSAATVLVATTSDQVEEDEVGRLPLSFLEVRGESPRQQLRGLTRHRGAESLREDRVVASLMEASKRLKSPSLALIAVKVGADPFKKVKKLIQELMERLVTEAADEASKEGWCNTEMGKATSSRDTNMEKMLVLNAETANFEAQKAELEEQVEVLTAEIKSLTDALSKATTMRTVEKEENMATIEEASSGLAAVKDAHELLQSFYKQAAKAKVALVQQPTANTGSQTQAGGILSMLEVIIGDFERTLKATKKADKDAQKEFVTFERASKASIASKDATKSQSEFTLRDTTNLIKNNMNDLEKLQSQLDDALKELEDLKPACSSSGMSYEERVQKRKAENEALKKALCELDTDKVEDECQ